ncbi:cytidylyltransferase domain-containing protein [Desulfolutivibrio sulfoxidireducens]|uniref:acylneuraminate cytidylyltransferase family protein n=1 Tax=Desulfolutivibrio sulfoxidireducens TaxID=2773299 RepID=UPI00159D2B66|nr:acylneuraminate cytidylyltransferase family protein [Desulfolutivibrio sulfoxidireducens]QLA18382.1 hypothetical protein GD604_00885 [Desulfolutivibrio sulfoxidireducens]
MSRPEPPRPASPRQPRRMAFIPARGGSKGLPRKNILPLCGMPLVAYSIRVALASGCFDRVIVSTEDPEIRDTARLWGGEVPFARPPELARDDSPIGDGLAFTLGRLRDQGYEPAQCVELYPTSPFRDVGLVRELVAALDAGFRNVWAVAGFSLEHPAYQAMDGSPLRPRPPVAPGRGLATLGLFHGFWLTNLEGLQPFGVFIKEIADPAGLVDIDGPADFRLAEHILENNLFDFGSPDVRRPPRAPGIG